MIARTSHNKRDQLIEAGLDLFNRYGFNATGIDRILAEAGVAKMTLYKHFRSKEELILAVLRRRDEIFREWLMDYVEGQAETPRERLLALFAAHGEWFSQKDFRGCLFQNAAAEFSGSAEAVRALAEEHKRLIHAYVRGLTSAAGARNPDRLADWLVLLLDGATGCAQVTVRSDWAGKARDAAKVLIDAELKGVA
jgi:AcrR family transcriptional regulator